MKREGDVLVLEESGEWVKWWKCEFLCLV